MPIRPRRSVLYMPGSNARAIDKARTLPVDGIILDLEDAVAPDAKADARVQVAKAVSAGGFGHREGIVRLYALDTPWFRDEIAAPAAIFNSRALAAKAADSESRLTGFVIGTNDLAKETRARIVPGRAPMVSWLPARAPPGARHAA